MKIPKRKRNYALYKGEHFITSGNMDEIAAIQDVKIGTVMFWSSPAYHRRVDAARSRNQLSCWKIVICID